jgi:D-glycero-D-manno-heptose 1,7-bisphosphate phosphatase
MSNTKDPHFLAKVDGSWTLFLDRDGVINQRILGDYVKNISEFHFLPNVLESIFHFTYIFNRIIIVTNQQGIAKQKYTISDLNKIHNYMFYEIEKANGRIDAVYFCPHIAGLCQCRKPEIGMAINAKKDFPDIDFSKSIMVGDSVSDMIFAKSAGMMAVKLLSMDKNEVMDKNLADIFATDLFSFYNLVMSYK